MGSGARSAKRGIGCLVAALALVPAVVKLLCYPHNIGSDDAYIHLRIAENFVHGLGWGINPHQPVNLSTSPAFTLLLAAMEWLTPHAIGVTQMLSAAAVIVGLVLIFLAAQAETGSRTAALVAEGAAAFSVNLWRWNGALMEASFGFAVVASTLFLFRKDAPESWPRLLGAGALLGIGVLLRPEMGLLVVLVLAVQTLRPADGTRVRNAALVLGGVFAVVLPWCAFAWRQMGSVIPTTFAAKSTSHLILLNGRILEQFVESIVESILFPTLLILLLLMLASRSPSAVSQAGPGGRSWVIPAGWTAGLIGFYYLKTHALQSTGRYVLPLLPCEVMLLALAWGHLEPRLTRTQLRLSAVGASLHVLFSLGLNYFVVMPVLQRFEPEYATTMRAAAEELARRIPAAPNRRVLVEEDIGVLSCAADGRFQIFDGGALATPSLRGLSLRDQVERVQPAFVLESLALTPAGLGPGYRDLLAQVWERRFRQHSVRATFPYYYAILYQGKEAAGQSVRR